jgi:hypothetical protein
MADIPISASQFFNNIAITNKSHAHIVELAQNSRSIRGNRYSYQEEKHIIKGIWRRIVTGMERRFRSALLAI